MSQDPTNRRSFLRTASTGIVLATAGGLATAARAQDPAAAAQAEEQPEEEVSPAEDLMREHGVLNRILLVYDESIRRLETNADLAPAAIQSSAKIVADFIEDYHEKLEEDFLFPRFTAANKLVDLVATLRAQHEAGRRTTQQIIQLTGGALAADDRRRLVAQLRAFVRMYRPHEAREDTVLFPALHSIVSQNEYDSLGEEFEDKEHEKFGEEGFFGVVDKVAEIEKQLGIYELAQFTPAS